MSETMSIDGGFSWFFWLTLLQAIFSKTLRKPSSPQLASPALRLFRQHRARRPGRPGRPGRPEGSVRPWCLETMGTCSFNQEIERIHGDL